MKNPIKNISVLKIAVNMGDAAVSLLEIYKTLLSAKYFAADSILKAVKVCKNSSAKLKSGNKTVSSPAVNDDNIENDKENTSMKKSTFWSLVAFLAAVCAAVAGIAYYLKKREAELEEYDDMLFNEDYLADYMPKDEDCCCDDCCETTDEAAAETFTEDSVEF